MSKLCITLPPFAPDYSGAASALYEMGGMIVIHDAAGCTGNYLGFDEPRSFQTRSLVYCSGLRHMDAVMGNDKKIIDKILLAARDLHPAFIALLGSPVPMVIGTDFTGMANELEVLSGIPSFGIATNGLSYYGKGSFLAWKALLDKFAGVGKKGEGKGSALGKKERISGEKRQKSINILGLTPLDFYTPPNKPSFLEEIKKLFEKKEYRILSVYGLFPRPGELWKTLEADVNLALSHSGYLLGRYMKERFGIPFVTGTPVGDGEALIKKIGNFFEGESEGDGEETAPEGSASVLIAGDQVMGNGIRDYLRERNPASSVTVASLFDYEADLAGKGDVWIRNETMLRELLNRGTYKKVLADPMIHRLVRDASTECIPLPHVAVSSKIYWKDCISYLGEDCRRRLETLLF